MIDLPFRQEIFQRHFHQDNQVLFGSAALFEEDRPRAVEHVVRRVGHGTKTSALHQDRFFVKNVGRLHHLAIGREHDRIGQTLAHELQTHESIIDLGEGRP